MDEIAIGRKEIMKALHVSDWRTIRDWKEKDEGFKKLVHVHRITGRPFIIMKEIIEWLLKYEHKNPQ